MRPKTIIVILFALFFLIIEFPSLAQNNDDQVWRDYDLEYRMFRAALIPGLSTNGINATNFASKYSLNILAGYNGALDDSGFEIGGLFNGNKYYAHGVQIAGLANYSGKETAGFQLAGLGTASGEQLQGIQLSGLGNWSGNDMQGIQIAGLFNRSFGVSQGLQFAGVLNMAQNDMQGLLVSGVANISMSSIQGLTFSGALNIAREDMQGIIATGGINYSRSFQGIGLGTLNSTKEFQGIQAGTVNIAESGQGIQIGIINFADEFEGVPIGIISYYGNGRQNIEFWSSETGFTNVGLKLGTQKVYNTISIGMNPFLKRDVWQLGWSIGKLDEYENHYQYRDFSFHKINEGSWTEDLNSVFKYRLLLGKELSNGFKIHGGPTFNMLVSSLSESSDYTFYRIFDIETSSRQYVFWIGASVGVELF